MRVAGPTAQLDGLHQASRRPLAWLRYHADGQFFCILVREKQLSRPEHIHILILVPNRKSALFAETVARWFPPDETDIDIRPARQAVMWTPAGKIRSAIGY